MHHLMEALSSEELMPHGMCFLWRPELIWLHVVADAGIALAYYSIPVALAYFVWYRRDLAFPGIFILFSVFILACGTTHVMAIWTLWRPDYWVDGGIKVLTATASLATAVIVWRVMPDALALPSADQLALANLTLEQQLVARRAAHQTAERLAAELDARVRERTRELEVANDRLRSTLEEKEVLLREVHHRVKNNLQVVAGLLTLQARKAAPEVAESYKDSLERIHAMGRVHQQLYRSEHATSFDLASYLDEVSAELGRIYGTAEHKVTCTVDAPRPAPIHLDAATPVALIVNEVLSNALKHAFPGGRDGIITVQLRRGGEETTLEIQDNGVGLSDDHAARSTSSMGLRLVGMLARQIGGRFSLEKRDGTRFALTWPDAAELSA